MSYQPPQSPFPPPPGTPTGPTGQPAGAPPGYPAPPAGPPPPGPAPVAGPPPGYGPPAPAAPRQPLSPRHLAAFIIVIGGAVVLLGVLLIAFLGDFGGGGEFGAETDFTTRLFQLGGGGGIPEILLVAVFVIAALRLREGTEGNFHQIIQMLGLIVAGLTALFVLLAFIGVLAEDFGDAKIGLIVVYLGALGVAAAAGWYAFGDFQSGRPARPSAPVGPPPGYYQQGPPGPPPQQQPPQPPPGYYQPPQG